MEEIVETMRKDIKFETISADVMDKKGREVGLAMPVTIAFTLAYDGKVPAGQSSRSPMCSPRSTSRRT